LHATGGKQNQDKTPVAARNINNVHAACVYFPNWMALVGLRANHARPGLFYIPKSPMI